MKVVILCGGKGTRLREETEYMPKPLVCIGGKPILWHIMKIYSYFGFNEFVLCLGYKGGMIKHYFLNYEMESSDFTIEIGTKNIDIHGSQNEKGWKITLVDTGLDSMTGSRLKQVEKYIDTEEFFLTYGDGVADVNINNLVEYHKAHGKIATITGVRPSSRFGELIVEGDRVLEFSEKPQTGNGLINGGFFVLNRKVFEYLSEDKDCIFEREPLEKIASRGELSAYQHDGFWQCMDTYRDLQFLNNLWVGKELEKELHFKSYSSAVPPWKIWKN